MSRISNYEELMAARMKTEAAIAEHKQVLREGIQDLKKKVEPIFYILNIFKKKDSNNHGNNSLLKVGASLAIDLLVGQNLLRKAGWLTRLLVPTLLKTVSSKVIEGNNGKSNDR